ncbi:MAG: phenylalanine--tRNA ligase subunit alpha [Candidatus Gastranaerophilaceae bacterium]
MKTKLQQLFITISEEIAQSKTVSELEEVKNVHMSRKSELNNIKKNLKDLSVEDKKIIGALTNKISSDLQNLLNEKFDELKTIERNEKLKSEIIDITLPGDYIPFGKVHPITKAINEITEIFQGMGFSIVSPENSPEVETEYINFDMLNFPKDHPARDMQDTYYCENAENTILRSQTSGAQIREMLTHKPPIRVISPGRVFRCESVSARKHNQFHQIEGLLIDKNVTFADLKGILNEFIKIYFGGERKTRLRNSFFPFTEPSCEVDVQCIMCNGKGCRTCSGSGWLEILGAGMVDVNVLKNVGIDPEEYSGFAFGMGVERMTMLKYAIDDIRLFFNNDMRFLSQFKGK